MQCNCDGCECLCTDEREKGVKTWLEDVYSSELLDPSLHRLALAATLVEEMRAAVFDKTGFRCSAGISHNKVAVSVTQDIQGFSVK